MFPNSNNPKNYWFLSITLLCICLVFISCNKKYIGADYFNIKKVINGNTIELRNGISVHLLGISNSPESFLYLTQYYSRAKVRLKFDNSSPKWKLRNRRTNQIFAYLLDEKNECINSVLLKKKLSPLVNDIYLKDSLYVYENYSGTRTKEKKRENNGKENNNRVYYSNNCDYYLDGITTACDYSDPDTRDFAVKTAGRSSGEFNIVQVCEIFQACRPPTWKYVNDPTGMDYLSPASRTITTANFSGDCDDFAILIYSLITAIGGRARVCLAWSGTSGHAFTEVDVSNFDETESLRTIQKYFDEFEIHSLVIWNDNGRKWLNLDWWSGYPGGKYFQYSSAFYLYPLEHKCSE